jgi:hypothetical protein
MLPIEWLFLPVLVTLVFPWYLSATPSKWMKCLTQKATATLSPPVKVGRKKTKPVFQKCGSKNLSEEITTTQMAL